VTSLVLWPTEIAHRPSRCALKVHLHYCSKIKLFRSIIAWRIADKPKSFVLLFWIWYECTKILRIPSFFSSITRVVFFNGSLVGIYLKYFFPKELRISYSFPQHWNLLGLSLRQISSTANNCWPISSESRWFVTVHYTLFAARNEPLFSKILLSFWKQLILKWP